ncbi:hypothetical protein C0991_002297 [Blastosporella zonata]|nr:hypothetical protein C0991_002297 [Blastosporella zonata]
MASPTPSKTYEASPPTPAPFPYVATTPLKDSTVNLTPFTPTSASPRVTTTMHEPVPHQAPTTPNVVKPTPNYTKTEDPKLGSPWQSKYQKAPASPQVYVESPALSVTPSIPALCVSFSEDAPSPLHEAYETTTPRDDPLHLINLPLSYIPSDETSTFLPPLEPQLMDDKKPRGGRKRRSGDLDDTRPFLRSPKRAHRHASAQGKTFLDMTVEEQDAEIYACLRKKESKVRFDPMGGQGSGRRSSLRKNRSHRTVDAPSPDRREDSPPPRPATPYLSYVPLPGSLPSPESTPPPVNQELINAMEAEVKEMKKKVSFLKDEYEMSRRKSKARKDRLSGAYAAARRNVKVISRKLPEEEAPHTAKVDGTEAFGLAALLEALPIVEPKAPRSRRSRLGRSVTPQNPKVRSPDGQSTALGLDTLDMRQTFEGGPSAGTWDLDPLPELGIDWLGGKEELQSYEEFESMHVAQTIALFNDNVQELDEEEDLSQTLTSVQLNDTVDEPKLQRPLTIRIPTLASLRSRASPTPPTV